jgi:hypothetical protein
MQLMQQLVLSIGIRFSGIWYEYHISLHMSSGLVVLAMGNFPGEIWDQQHGMANPTHCIVELFAGRERLMSALMRQNPQTGTEKTLHESVQCP